MNETLTIKRTDVIIPDRLRKDYGDIEDFAAGIAELGHLIQPVVLNRKAVGVGDANIISDIIKTYPIKYEYTLLAGGRRTKAMELLGWDDWVHGIHFVFKEELPEHLALEIELAENTERLDMTWQERVNSIWRIHSLKVKANAQDGKDWGHLETGRLVGLSKTHVGIAIQVAKCLAANDEKATWINGATNFRDAIGRLMKSKEDEGLKHAAAHLIQKPDASVQSYKEEPTGEDEEELYSGETAEEVLKDIQTKTPVTTIEITKIVHNINCLEFMRAMEPGTLDAHIITDPPYGIKMDHLVGDKIESVRAEHDVEDNFKLLREFIPEAFRVLKDKRFMVLFCDMEHFNTLLKIGTDAGFKATRWPLVWVKTHHCQNNCAQYNFTKATEDAIVFRKGDAILARPPQSNWYYGDNVDVRKKHGGHPFVKPKDLWTWIASHVALKGQTIFDPFMGEGSCGEAVLPMGWNYLGCESNQTHYAKAVVYLCEYFSGIYNGKVRFV